MPHVPAQQDGPGPHNRVGAFSYLREVCANGFQRCPAQRRGQLVGSKWRAHDGSAMLIADTLELPNQVLHGPTLRSPPQACSQRRDPGPHNRAGVVSRRGNRRNSLNFRTTAERPVPKRRTVIGVADSAAMKKHRRPDVWAPILRTLHGLRQSWHKTGACLIPDCQERAMHFPPSRFCKVHTS